MRRESSVARYLLARLRPLGRPVFWAPSIALLLLVLFTWEFWSRPEWMSAFGTAPSEIDSSVSPEDQAIAAEIDSLPLLINDIGIAPKPKASTNPTNPASTETPQSSTPTATAPRSTAPTTAPQVPSLLTPEPSTQGVFGVLSNALTARLGLSSATSASAPNSQNSTSQSVLNFASTPAPLPANRLQEAIAQLQTQAQTVPASPAPAPIEGTTRVNNPAIDASNSFTNLAEGTQPLPRSANFPGGTIAPTVIAPTIAPAIAAPVTTQPLPVQTQSFGNAAGAPDVPQSETTMSLNQQPFSVPRPVPGRFIGGGKINTFSNP